MNPQEIARSPSVKDNIGTQYSGLRTAAKTTRASAVLVTSQLVSNHVVSKSTQSQIQNCVNLTCPHLKKKTEDGFYGLHAHPFVGNAFVVFDRSRFGAKKNTHHLANSATMHPSLRFWVHFLGVSWPFKPCRLTVTSSTQRYSIAICL